MTLGNQISNNTLQNIRLRPYENKIEQIRNCSYVFMCVSLTKLKQCPLYPQLLLSILIQNTLGY